MAGNGTRRGYVGWALPLDDRARLLQSFPPRYGRVIGHHVTLVHGVNAHYPLPRARRGHVVGIADDGAGIEALIVAIDGPEADRVDPTRRKGSGHFHITWSLGPDRTPVMSNDVIRTNGWQPVDPVAITLEPRFFAP